MRRHSLAEGVVCLWPVYIALLPNFTNSASRLRTRIVVEGGFEIALWSSKHGVTRSALQRLNYGCLYQQRRSWSKTYWVAKDFIFILYWNFHFY